MSDKIFKIVMVVLVVGALGGALLFGRGSGDEQSQLSDHTYGKADSTVRLVEYGDFQCPACYRYYPVLKQVKEKYKDKIAFQFRNFPIVQAHPNAMAAHRSAEAASKQGKFWEMHDLLYERQQSWAQSTSPAEIFESYAEEIGLDIEQYKVDHASSEASGAIGADLEEGRDVGAAGTPSFVLNGEKIESPEPTLEAFSELIDQKLAETQ